jgi:hypothetical protein
MVKSKDPVAFMSDGKRFDANKEIGNDKLSPIRGPGY